MKTAFFRFCKKYRGQSGISGVKQIAGTVAVIVIIGAVVTAITGTNGTLEGWIDDVWKIFIDEIKTML